MLIFLLALIVLFCVYFFLIIPRVFGKTDMSVFGEYLYAHRGLHDNATEAPENSLVAFRRAVEAGFGIELDVQLTKDKIPVVFHDFALERMCGQPGKVKDYTYEELQQFTLLQSNERIPQFKDVLDLVDGRTPLIVELKIESADITVCPVVDELLSQYKGLYCIESFNPLGLLWYRKHHKKVIRGQLSNAFLRDGKSGGSYFFLQNLLLNFVGRPDFISYNCRYPRMLSKRICCEILGAVSVGWTICSQEELEQAKKYFDIYIFEGFNPCR